MRNGAFFCSFSVLSEPSAFQKQAPLSERPLYRKLGHANLVELFILTISTGIFAMFFQRTVTVDVVFFIHGTVHEDTEISTYSVHVQYMYTLYNIVLHVLSFA